MISSAKRILVLFLLLPFPLSAQITDRAAPSDDPVPGQAERPGQDIREVHYTHRLLQSEEGRKAMQVFREHSRTAYPATRAGKRQDLVGDTRRFFVRNPEESTDTNPEFDEVMFELRRSGGNVELWVEVDELGPGKVTEEILDEMMDGLINETPPNSIDPSMGVIEIGRDLFGDQPDVDGSGILRILITDIEDGYNPPEQLFFIAGFFDPVNLVSQTVIPESNEADILYINSNPGVYREDVPVVNTRLNTMAHEFQHLIQANYAAESEDGGLSLFQNEGQSELAEILSGFDARAMNFLDSKSELSGDVEGPEGWVYKFRQTEGDVVLYDYQRAQLLHSYLAERVGPEAAGSLTQSDTFNDAAYEEVLAPAGITLADFFTDFYISAYGNNRVEGEGRFGFSRPQFSGLRVANPGEFYNFDVQPWIRDREEVIYYGGSLYTQWFGVESLTLEIHSTEGISQNLLWRRPGESQYSHMATGPGIINLENGIYEEIILVSTNTEPSDGAASPSDSRTFTYSGDWSTTGLIAEELVYHSEAGVQSPLPWDDIFTYSMRISPEFDSGVRNVAFTLNYHENAVLGDGLLELVLREAVPSPAGPGFVPGSLIASQPFTPNDVSAGENFIGVNSDEWQVEGGQEYFISVEVIEDLGGLYLEFLFDNGTADVTEPDTNYNPARTLYGVRDNGGVNWGTLNYVDEEAVPPEERYNLNALMSAQLVGFTEIEIPGFPAPPVSESFELVKNYPNPFGSETVIEFNVPEQASLRISLHDILGREVKEIFNGVAPTGLHSVKLPAGELASGIYFYRMISPQGVQSRKMTLIR